MSDADYILKGPPVGPIPDCSLGEYLYPQIISHKPDLMFQVEDHTGAEQTIGEFLTMSVRLSEGLRKLGLEEGDVVGMMCKNCFEACEIVLGSWLGGAAVAPADGRMTVAEMKYYLELVKPKFLFCDEEAIENATEALKQISVPCPVISVGKNKANVNKLQNTHKSYEEVLVDTDMKNYKPQPVKSPSTQPVAILLSSGTSGLPKAVVITHRNFIFQHINVHNLYPINQKLVVLQISHFYWVTAFFFFFKPLTDCTKRVLMRVPTPENILRAIEKYKIQYTFMGPSLAFALVKHPNFDKYDLSSMKTILLGGSKLTESVGKLIKEKWKTVELSQNYGMTEISGPATSTQKDGDIYSLGKVLPAIQLKVVDESTGKALKANSLGEILIKCPGIMKGYLGNEQATKEAVDSEGWYHSGDLGYYDESGQVYLVDRIKELVKIMNMQISPSEIENAILNIPGILEAGVAGVTKDENVYELLAMVVKEKNSTVTEKDIHAHIANTLSEYKKLTGGIYFVDSLPKTSSAKPSRKEIRKIAQSLYSKACDGALKE